VLWSNFSLRIAGANMRESESQQIKFPAKDPGVWELILRCIDPAGATLFGLHDDFESENDRDSVLNESNFHKLIPAFHELQMDNYLFRCDRILSSTTTLDTDEKDVILGLLSVTTMYNLQYTQMLSIKGCWRRFPGG
jgi:hypothetical protein